MLNSGHAQLGGDPGVRPAHQVEPEQDGAKDPSKSTPTATQTQISGRKSANR